MRSQLSVVIAALLAAITWNLFTLWLGLPSSSSHALVGGLIGAAVIQNGWSVIQPAGLGKVLLALAISPPLGFLTGYLVTKVVLFLARGASPRINTLLQARTDSDFLRAGALTRDQRRPEGDGRYRLGTGLGRRHP